MNNLYRELAPITDSAWAGIEEEAKRTFATYVAGRRIVDVDGPDELQARSPDAVLTGNVAATIRRKVAASDRARTMWVRPTSRTDRAD